MVEPLINHWTIDHFFFGLGISLITYMLLRKRNPEYTVPLFVLILWEMFEFRESQIFWISNYLNNIMDVIVGFIAVVITVSVSNKILEYVKTRTL